MTTRNGVILGFGVGNAGSPEEDRELEDADEEEGGLARAATGHAPTDRGAESLRVAYPPPAGSGGESVLITAIDPELRPASLVREAEDAETIQDYTRDFESLPAVVLMRDTTTGEIWVADGRHRIVVAKKRGEKSVTATVREGSYQDALRRACHANSHHGLRPTGADKRRRVAAALDIPEIALWSSKKVAEFCDVSDTTVNTVRSDRTANHFAVEDGQPKRLAKDGRLLPAKGKKLGRGESKSSKKSEPKPESTKPAWEEPCGVVEPAKPEPPADLTVPPEPTAPPAEPEAGPTAAPAGLLAWEAECSFAPFGRSSVLAGDEVEWAAPDQTSSEVQPAWWTSNAFAEVFSPAPPHPEPIPAREGVRLALGFLDGLERRLELGEAEEFYIALRMHCEDQIDLLTDVTSTPHLGDTVAEMTDADRPDGEISPSASPTESASSAEVVEEAVPREPASGSDEGGADSRSLPDEEVVRDAIIQPAEPAGCEPAGLARGSEAHQEPQAVPGSIAEGGVEVGATEESIEVAEAAVEAAVEDMEGASATPDAAGAEAAREADGRPLGATEVDEHLDGLIPETDEGGDGATIEPPEDRRDITSEDLGRPDGGLDEPKAMPDTTEATNERQGEEETASGPREARGDDSGDVADHQAEKTPEIVPEPPVTTTPGTSTKGGRWSPELKEAKAARRALARELLSESWNKTDTAISKVVTAELGSRCHVDEVGTVRKEMIADGSAELAKGYIGHQPARRGGRPKLSK